ncbi:hypothetical protein D3C73_1181180 [compost metagenome]
MVEQPGIGGQIGAWRAADRLLVHLHYPLDGVYITCQLASRGFDHGRPVRGRALRSIVCGLMPQVQQHQLRQCLRHQAGLAGARNAGHCGQQPQRQLRIHTLQVVAVDALQFQPTPSAALPAGRCRHLVEQIPGCA